MFVICVEAIMYLLLYDLHDCTFKSQKQLKQYGQWKHNCLGPLKTRRKYHDYFGRLCMLLLFWCFHRLYHCFYVSLLLKNNGLVLILKMVDNDKIYSSNYAKLKYLVSYIKRKKMLCFVVFVYFIVKNIKKLIWLLF